MNVILSTIIWAPLLFALIALFLPEHDEEQRARVRTVALGGAGVSFFVTTFFAILGQIGLGQGGGLASAYQENHTWFSNFLFQAHYDLVADGITLPLLVVVTTVFGCAIFHSWKIHERVRLYVILVLLLETAVNGVLCASDFVLFVAFWGLLLLADVPAHPDLGWRRRASSGRMVRGIPCGVAGADHRDSGNHHRGGGRSVFGHERRPDQVLRYRRDCRFLVELRRIRHRDGHLPGAHVDGRGAGQGECRAWRRFFPGRCCCSARTG